MIVRSATWLLIALYALLLVATAALWLSGAAVPQPSLLVVGTVFAGVGAVLVVRRPRNAVGWLCLALALTGTSQVSAETYATRALIMAPGTLPGGAVAAWWAGWIATPTFLILTMFLPLLFPTGRPPSPRWRPLLWASFACLAMYCVFVAFTPGPLVGASQFENPFGVALLGEAPAVFASGILFVSQIALSVACVASLIVRYRHAGSTERQQLKWFTWAFVFMFLLLLGSSVQGIFGVAETRALSWLGLVWQISVAMIPIAIGIAILRYRLYDIDVLINRTLVYGLTTGGIAIAFFGGIAVLQTLLRSFTTGSEIAVAASTLLTVAVLQPLRSRIPQAVDRRFYRGRYDAARTVDAFAEELRDEVDLDAVRARLLGAVGQTMSPAHASLWLREGAR
ncbi:MAG: hypothetical protein M3T56_05915 [Chloroflexota bacterium]|nr:hypothetical protein [Chloroflexota bacterium]